jgi:chitinase
MRDFHGRCTVSMLALLATSCGGGGNVSIPSDDACARGVTCPAPEAGAAITDASIVDCPPGFLCYPQDARDAAPVPQGMVQEGGSEAGAAPPACPSGFVCVPFDASTGGVHGAADGGPEAGADATVEGGPVTDASTAIDAADAMVVHDGGATPAPPSPELVLHYRVVDAKQSAALASLVIVSDTPSNALHIFNEQTQADQPVALPAAPVAVAVEPRGLRAAVAYDAHVSWVDLQAGTILATCNLSSNAYGLALTDAGIAYVVPRTDQWVPFHSINLSTCTETTSSNLYAGQHAALHPSQLAVFTADQGLSPSRINRCDISASPPTCTDAENSADWGTYNYCGNLWISADGQRIYTACGVTLRVPGNVNGSPATYGGTLSGVSAIKYMDEAPAAQEIAVIPSNTDSLVRIHETQYLGFVRQVSLPSFPLPDAGSSVAHGRFVFTTPTLDMLYVILQADASSGALDDFAVASFRP